MNKRLILISQQMSIEKPQWPNHQTTENTWLQPNTLTSIQKTTRSVNTTIWETPEKPEAFLKEMWIDSNRGWKDRLNWKIMDLARAMDYDDMKKFLAFMEKNPKLFTEKYQDKVLYLEYRVWIIDELRNTELLSSKYGKKDQTWVDTIIKQHNSSGKLADRLNKIKSQLKEDNSDLIYSNTLDFLGIKLGSTWGDPRTDFLYWVSRRKLDWNDPMKEAIFQRINQILQRIEELKNNDM